MYLKILGSLLVILGAAAWGASASGELRKRLEELEYLERIIWQINGEMSYTKAPLGEVFRRVEKRIREPYRSWLAGIRKEMEGRAGLDFGSLWEKRTGRDLKGTFLKKEDRDELAGLGHQMGYLDVRMQEETLSWYAGRLARERQELLAGLKEEQRILGCLSVAGGIFLVVLFF